MNDKAFLDSNILVYTYSNSELEKQFTARKFVTENNTFISTQVLQELCNILTRKFKFSYQQALKVIAECASNSSVHINTESTIKQACQIGERYGYSFYDCMIVASALESNCVILYSEDLQHGQVINDRITIKNPFLQLVFNDGLMLVQCM